MMADAADELSALVRFLDRENVETEKLNGQLGKFMSRCHWLFGPRRGVLEQGFTKNVMVELRKPIVWVYTGRPRSLGSESGFSQESVNSAIDVMAGWLRLAACEIRCESPSIEIIQATLVSMFRRIAWHRTTRLTSCAWGNWPVLMGQPSSKSLKASSLLYVKRFVGANVQVLMGG